MKVLFSLVSALFFVPFAHAHTPLSQAEALKQIYHEYDESHKTAQWVCRKEDDSRCWEGDEATVSITLLLIAEVNEGGLEKMYVVASAKPAHAPTGYECHSCAPAIGVAVFAWQRGSWSLQSVNPFTGLFGSWGEPADVDLVSVGPDLHGIILTTSFGGLGYFGSTKTLLIVSDDTIKAVWDLQDESSNAGAYDPFDQDADHVLYHATAGIRFFANDEQDAAARKHYDIEVISRGKDRRGKNNAMRDENWTEIFRYHNGEYKLFSRDDFVEIKRKTSPTRH